MSRTRVKLNIKGFNALRKSPEMVAGLQELADGIAGRAGNGYGTDMKYYGSRAVASVYTESYDAMRECSRTSGDPLLRALQS